MIGVDTTFLIHLEIQEAAEHVRAKQTLEREVLATGTTLVLVPQVLSEFLHVVTDQRRFQRPFTMSHALERATYWWNAREVRRVFPTTESTSLFLDWIGQHRLGRKRLLDTMLAATLHLAGVRRLVSSNAADFSDFGVFDVIVP